VCPVDFSDCSRRALRYAGALAAHFCSRLSVVHVADPFLAGAVVSHELDLLADNGKGELREFVNRNLRPSPAKGFEPDITLIVGAPAREIVSFATERRADLIVMGTHGYSGARKTYFGSTAEYVLRQSRVPVLTVPLATTREADVVAPLVSSGPVIAPVDFSPESYTAAHAAAGLARALDLPLLLLHVEEETAVARAGRLLSELAQTLDHHLPIEARILRGTPGQEIANVARHENASLVVLSLASAAHGSKHQPGSVAYSVLCLAPTPILALPVTQTGHIFVTHLHETTALASVG
jgi:nucleotide-binding universal stress UspA family protein